MLIYLIATWYVTYSTKTFIALFCSTVDNILYIKHLIIINFAQTLYVLAHLSAYLTAIITHHSQYIVYNQCSRCSLTFASENQVASDLKHKNYSLQRLVTSVKFC